MNIHMLYPGLADELPPLVTASVCMKAAGAEVNVIAGGCRNSTQSLFSSLGIGYYGTSLEKIPEHMAGKLAAAAEFGALVMRMSMKHDPDVIWCHAAHGARFFRLAMNARRLLVVHAHEIYPARSWNHRMQSRALGRADLCICPEENRAWVLRFDQRTSAKFIVIPNRLPSKLVPTGYGETVTRQVFLDQGGSPDVERFVIYQGAYRSDRCLVQLVEGFRQLDDPHTGLILMGFRSPGDVHDAVRARIQGDRRIVQVPGMPAPEHLKVTQGCHAGVLLYDDSDLNNIYCAPNKVFEYAYFGLGMLIPNYPSLRHLPAMSELAEACDPGDPRSISDGLRRLLRKPNSQFQAAAEHFLSGTPTAECSYESFARELQHLASEAIAKRVEANSSCP